MLMSIKLHLIHLNVCNLYFYMQVVAGSIAFKAGLKPGDGILQIGQLPTEGMTHEQAKMEIIRSGNDLDFIIQR